MIGSVWGLLLVVLASVVMAALWMLQVRLRDASHDVAPGPCSSPA